MFTVPHIHAETPLSPFQSYLPYPIKKRLLESHLIHEKTKAQKGYITCPRSLSFSYQVQKLEIKPKNSTIVKVVMLFAVGFETWIFVVCC